MSTSGSSPWDAWEVRMSRTHDMPYFFNTKTQQSSWDCPDEIPPKHVKDLRNAELLAEASKKDGMKAHNAEALDQRPTQTWRASHILVKHKHSRRPSSWREASITRTKDEAIKILLEYKSQIDGAPDMLAKFEEIASQFSDCSSHSKAGDLGRFSKGEMQKPFEDAVASLSPGSISDVVTTDSGEHLILRKE